MKNETNILRRRCAMETLKKCPFCGGEEVKRLLTIKEIESEVEDFLKIFELGNQRYCIQNRSDFAIALMNRLLEPPRCKVKQWQSFYNCRRMSKESIFSRRKELGPLETGERICERKIFFETEK